MAIINNLLQSAMTAAQAPEVAQLPTRLTAAIKVLEADKKIHPLMRADMLALLNNTISLVEASADESYHIDVFTDALSVILSTSSNLMAHITHNRPTLYAFGIEHVRNKTLMAAVFRTESEAQHEIEQFKNLGLPEPLKVVPIRLSSQIVNRVNAGALSYERNHANEPSDTAADAKTTPTPTT